MKLEQGIPFQLPVRSSAYIPDIMNSRRFCILDQLTSWGLTEPTFAVHSTIEGISVVDRSWVCFHSPVYHFDALEYESFPNVQKMNAKSSTAQAKAAPKTTATIIQLRYVSV